MLNDTLLERILSAMPKLKIGVLGDLFLDRYLEIDGSLTEPSVETGLDAYQVAAVRSQPGAAGTVINNLAAFGVGSIVPISLIGDDGEGYELRQALTRMPEVKFEHILVNTQRRTPTYTKPMLHAPGQPARELNRFDIKNRTPLSTEAENSILQRLDTVLRQVDGLLILDQVSEAECGVVTTRVRDALSAWGVCHSAPLLLADSRERIGLFRNVWTKPNERECRLALGATAETRLTDLVERLSMQTRRPVFGTAGEHGIQGYDPARQMHFEAKAYRVPGPIDVVGAGDSANAALMTALLAGAGHAEAAAFANLVASITIQQLGDTGTAPPAAIRMRWREVDGI
jgi:rfaE bifunctional protein kinase chain/domain